MKCGNRLDIRHQFRGIFYSRDTGETGVAARRITLFSIRSLIRVCHFHGFLLLPIRFPNWSILICGRFLRAVKITHRLFHRHHFRLRRLIHGFYVRSFRSGPFHPGFLLPDPCFRRLLRRICGLFHLFSDALRKCFRLLSGALCKCL